MRLDINSQLLAIRVSLSMKCYMWLHPVYSSTESLGFFFFFLLIYSSLNIFLCTFYLHKLQHYSEIANLLVYILHYPQNSLRTGSLWFNSISLEPGLGVGDQWTVTIWLMGWLKPRIQGVTSFRETVMFIYLTLISPLFLIPSTGQLGTRLVEQMNN